MDKNYQSSMNRTIASSLCAFIVMILTSVATTAQNRLSDITVIFCGMPERVEVYAMEDFAEILRMRESGEIGSNISIAGVLKLGEESFNINWQKEMAPYGYDGTLYIDIGQKNGHEIPKMSGDTVRTLATYLKEFNARKFASKNFPFFNSDSLAHIIQTVATDHPAKTYILCLFGHGNGKHCFRDDYFPNRRGATAEELEKAIGKSGINIHTLFFHHCLMGNLENLIVYQNCAKYAVLSPQETCGGYIHKYLSNLSKSEGKNSKLLKLTKETIDFYAKTAAEPEESETSQGCYNLSKVNSLLNTVKDIDAWYEDAIKTDSQLVISAVHSSVLVNEPDMDSTMVLSDFMNQTITLSKTTNTNSDIHQLKTLFKHYMSQLKDMAYIKCNHMKGKTQGYPYLHASPSIRIDGWDTITSPLHKALGSN